jgi:alpha/beta hydrolase family protein
MVVTQDISSAGFSVEDEAMLAATSRLRDPLGRLGDTRQGLAVRQVPTEAFGRVDGSRTAGTRHAGNVTDFLDQLAAKAAALRTITDGVSSANQRYRQFDDAKAKVLGPDGTPVADAGGDATAARNAIDERDRAARERIRQALAAEQARVEELRSSDEPYRGVPELAAAQERIRNYEQILATDDARILSFDPEGEGRFVALIGDLDDRTGSVGVFVPGMRTGLDDFVGDKNIMGSFAMPAGEHGGTAMVVWADGDFPQALGAASPDAAQEMAPRLRDFVNNDLRAMTGDSVPITVIGHSYGGAIVGLADAAGMDANNVVHVESAGMGYGVTPEALQAANPDVTRYSITSPHDPISVTQQLQGLGAPFGLGHGLDPDTFPGNIPLASGGDADGTIHYGFDAHSLENVLGQGSDSWRNVRDILTGAR